MTNRRPQSSPMGQWHDIPGCKVKRDLESWGKPCESSRPPQEPAATTLTGSSGCCGDGDTEVHPSTEAEMGRRQSSAGLWPQNSGRRVLGKRKLRQIGRCGGTQGWLFGQWPHFVQFMLRNLSIPQSTGQLITQHTATAVTGQLSPAAGSGKQHCCTSFHGNQNRRSCFPPKSH